MTRIGLRLLPLGAVLSLLLSWPGAAMAGDLTVRGETLDPVGVDPAAATVERSIERKRDEESSVLSTKVLS